MKILRIIPSMHPSYGGPCQGIRNIIPELQKLGVQNDVVSLDSAETELPASDPFPVYKLGHKSNPWSYSPQLLPWLTSNLAHYDIVIIHGLWLYPGYAIRKALKYLRRDMPSASVPKTFIMPHGMLDPYFQRAKSRKLKAIRNWFYWKAIESKTISMVDGLLFTCQQELILAKEAFSPYIPKNELNVGYGILPPPTNSEELQQSFYQKCPETASQNFILFLSRIHPKKGVDMLIQAYTNLLKNHTSKDLPNLVIAGPGLDTTYGKQILKKITENSILKSKVLFPGMLTGNSKWGAFYECQAFILPSHQENFGIAVVEALACKKAALLTNQVNIWREIKEAGGAIVADDSVEGVEKLLKQWLTMSSEQQKHMGQCAYNAFQTHYAIHPAANNLLKALQNS